MWIWQKRWKPKKTVKAANRLPVSPNLNPESHLFEIWILNPSHLEIWIPENCFEIWIPESLKSESWILPFLKFESWILPFLKFESRIPGLFEIWIQNPWIPPYRTLFEDKSHFRSPNLPPPNFFPQRIYTDLRNYQNRLQNGWFQPIEPLRVSPAT